MSICKEKQYFAKPHCVDCQLESANDMAWRTHKHQVLAVSSFSALFAFLLLVGKGMRVHTLDTFLFFVANDKRGVQLKVPCSLSGPSHADSVQ
jgi:hypothetical protein